MSDAVIDINKVLKETWLDKTVSWIAPGAGLKRMAARYKQEQARLGLKQYDAATQGRRTKGWKAGHTSQNTEVKMSLKTLQARSRDLVRNEPFARRAVEVIVGNIVGAGILAKAMGKTEGRSKIFQTEWNDWADSLDCDYDGQNNFYGLQALAARTLVESGEVLVKRVKRDSSFGLTIPFQIQILEPDFIDIYRDGETLENGNFTIQGVEFNAQGKRVAYYLFERHPGDNSALNIRGFSSKRVSAEDIHHILRVERAGQVRGIPWLAPAMLKIHDLSDYSDAVLLRQKLAACFTAFVTTPDAGDLTGPNKDLPPLSEKMEPGIIEVLGQGQSIEFANPPTSGDFDQFTRAQLRAIASAIGVTYEALTNDYSNVNFSSGRLGWIEFQRNVDMWRWHIIIPHFCIPTWRWFVEAAAVSGLGTDKVSSRWTPPRREMIDPIKEAEGMKNQIRSGLMSQSEAIRENGRDPDEVFKEIADDNAKIDKLLLVLDSDPRQDIKLAEAKASANSKQTNDAPQNKKKPKA